MVRPSRSALCASVFLAFVTVARLASAEQPRILAPRVWSALASTTPNPGLPPALHANAKNLLGQTPPPQPYPPQPYPPQAYPPYPYPYPPTPYPPPYYPYGPYPPPTYGPHGQPYPYPLYPPPVPQPSPYPYRPPPPPASPSTPEKPDWVPSSGSLMGAAVAQIGLRGMIQSTSGADRDVPIGGAGLGGWLFAVGGADHFSGRMELREHIGGSGAGLDGQYGGDLAAGLRLPLGPFALVARLGTGGEILGNGKLLWWTYRLPEADAGFHVGDGRVFFEATGLGGVTLGGNFLVGDEGARKIGTAGHAGARATLGIQPFVATASYRRIFESQNGPATPIDALDGATCAIVGDWAGLAICAEGRIFRGEAGYPGGATRESTVYYGGLTIALGALVTGGMHAP